VTPAAVWLGDDGGTLLGGFAPPILDDGDDRKNGQLADQWGLATTAAAALTGLPTLCTTGIPASLSGVPGVVFAVLARAAGESATRFPSVDAFARAFDTAIAQAGEELIAGVWEALGRRDEGMAAIMLDMAAGYAPEHHDHVVLRARMTGRSGVDDVAGVATGWGGSLPVESGLSSLTPATPADAAAIAALLNPPMPVAVRPTGNPWVAFAAGMFGSILMLVVAIALAMAYT
jgi:hypothetical protein